MGGYGTEITTAEAPPVRIDREFNHIVGRDSLALVAGMRQFCIGHIPEGIHFFLSCRRVWRVNLYVTIATGLYNRLGLKHIGLGFYLVEVLGKGLFALEALLVRMKNQGIFGRWFPFCVEAYLLNLPYLMQVPAGLYSPGKLQHRPFSHSVAKIISPAANKYGGKEFILPVIVVGEPSQ